VTVACVVVAVSFANPDPHEFTLVKRTCNFRRPYYLSHRFGKYGLFANKDTLHIEEPGFTVKFNMRDRFDIMIDEALDNTILEYKSHYLVPLSTY